MKKLFALAIVAILLAGLIGLAMARCTKVTPATIDLSSEGMFKVTIWDEYVTIDDEEISIAENADPSTVTCEGASAVRSQLTGNDKKLMLWFNIRDLVGVVEPGDEVTLTVNGNLSGDGSFDLTCEPIRVISGEEE
jgi:hypothetical protein